MNNVTKTLPLSFAVWFPLLKVYPCQQWKNRIVLDASLHFSVIVCTVLMDFSNLTGNVQHSQCTGQVDLFSFLSIAARQHWFHAKSNGMRQVYIRIVTTT